jgi:hypothetical protein
MEEIACWLNLSSSKSVNANLRRFVRKCSGKSLREFDTLTLIKTGFRASYSIDLMLIARYSVALTAGTFSAVAALEQRPQSHETHLFLNLIADVFDFSLSVRQTA